MIYTQKGNLYPVEKMFITEKRKNKIIQHEVRERRYKILYGFFFSLKNRTVMCSSREVLGAGR